MQEAETALAAGCQRAAGRIDPAVHARGAVTGRDGVETVDRLESLRKISDEIRGV